MQINLLENPDFVLGAHSFGYYVGAYHFFRLNEELIEFYSQSETSNIRAYCTSGVRISFITDSSTLAMDVLYGKEFARPIFSIDLIVDDEEKMTFSPNEHVQEFQFSTELPGEGKRKVEIYLPHASQCAVRELRLDAGSLTEALPPRPAILFTGDSITQGMTVNTPNLTYPAQLAQILDMDFHNVAIGGAVFNERIAQGLMLYDWEKAYVAFGVNDFSAGRSLEELAKECRGILSVLTSRENAEINLITPLPWALRTNPNKIGLRLEEYRETLRQVAKEFPNVQVIEGCGLVPDESQYFVDNVHPNNTGASMIAENLAQKQHKISL